jgi:predicted RNase H-like nuclease (RuvC/YqgF family)
MTWDTGTVVSLIAALGVGGIIQGIIKYFQDRKKVDSDTTRTDVDTQLAYLKTVIEQLGNEVKRVVSDRDRIQEELLEEQSRSAILRRRVRELEDEIDGVRRSARETQHKCDELATRLQQLVDDSQEQ